MNDHVAGHGIITRTELNDSGAQQCTGFNAQLSTKRRTPRTRNVFTGRHNDENSRVADVSGFHCARAWPLRQAETIGHAAGVEPVDWSAGPWLATLMDPSVPGTTVPRCRTCYRFTGRGRQWYHGGALFTSHYHYAYQIPW